MKLYLLFECAVGYALFEREEFDEVNTKLTQVQKTITDFKTFSKSVTLEALHSFETGEISLNQIQSIAKGEVSEELNNFLSENLPLKKKKKFCLGVQENKLGASIANLYQIEIKNSNVIQEMFRGIKQHFTKYLKNKDFKENDLIRASLGLAHAFSRSKVGDNLNRQDKHIIQSSALIDLMDKNMNQFCMRIKEWFGWHFPEMSKIITDNEVYVKIVNLIRNKESIDEEMVPQIEEITNDGDLAQQLYDASKQSMGNQLSELDENNIHDLSSKLIQQFAFKKHLSEYLREKMDKVAPNLTTLLGESVAAKLISQAGSLVTLAKYPASTVQILGAEKALFRALKTKGNTPKYGLLFNSSYISRADTKSKGKISRYLANKCSIAARLDSFLVNPVNRFGEKLKNQVENRLKFVKGDMNDELEKNEDVMAEVLNELRNDGVYYDSIDQTVKKDKKDKKKSKKGKRKETIESVQSIQEKKKKKKKVKSEEVEEEVEEVEQVEKKKKKKKSVK